MVPPSGLLLAGGDLGVGDHDAVGIVGAGDFALELRVGAVEQQRGVGVVDHGIALPVVEGHLVAALPKLGLRLGQRHFAGRDLVLQRLRHADQQIDRGAHLR